MLLSTVLVTALSAASVDARAIYSVDFVVTSAGMM